MIKTLAERHQQLESLRDAVIAENLYLPMSNGELLFAPLTDVQFNLDDANIQITLANEQQFNITSQNDLLRLTGFALRGAGELYSPRFWNLAKTEEQTACNNIKRLLDLQNAFGNLMRAVQALAEIERKGAQDADDRKNNRVLYHYFQALRASDYMKVSDLALTRKAQSEFYAAFRLYPWEYADFTLAYLRGFENKKQEKRVAQAIVRRNESVATMLSDASSAIANTYSGCLDELLSWLKANVSSIEVHVPPNSASITKAQKIIEGLQPEQVPEDYYWWTLAADTTWSIAFEAMLKPHKDWSSPMPQEISMWQCLKRVGLDTYETRDVYVARSNKLTGNQIIMDLLFNYGFKLGKQ